MVYQRNEEFFLISSLKGFERLKLVYLKVKYYKLYALGSITFIFPAYILLCTYNIRTFFKKVKFDVIGIPIYIKNNTYL